MEDKIFNWMHKDITHEEQQMFQQFYELLKGSSMPASLFISAQMDHNSKKLKASVKAEGSHLSLIELLIEVTSSIISDTIYDATIKSAEISEAKLEEATASISLLCVGLEDMAKYNLYSKLHKNGYLGEDENGDFELVCKPINIKEQ